MARRRLKQDRCLNCGYAFPTPDDFHFCPRCGQENADRRAAIGMLAEEFVSTFVAYDSRFVRSIVPFLARPGFLTNAFVNGQRLSYVHPLRLYLLVSLLYFFVISQSITDADTVDLAPVPPAQISQLTRQVRAALPATPAAQPLADSVQQALTNDLGAVSLAARLTRTLAAKSPPDSVAANLRRLLRRHQRDARVIIQFGDDNSWDFNKLRRLAKSEDLTPEAALDSLGMPKTYWNRLAVSQFTKILRRDRSSIQDYVLDKLSWMLFFALPGFALLLKLFYARRRRLYIEHLVFTLHLHAFAFFVFTLLVGVGALDAPGWVTGLLWLLLGWYGWSAFRRVYHQGWAKTLAKIFLVGFSYVFFLTLLLVATLVVGFFIF